MDGDFKEILAFASIRKIILTFKHDLNVLSEIKREHDASLNKLHASLEDFEVFLREKHGVDIELTHLVNHAEFLDDDRMAMIRKRILDFGNTMKREMEEEFANS